MTGTSVIESFFESRTRITPDQLAREVDEYRQTAPETIGRLNAHVVKTYGFENASDVLEGWWHLPEGATDRLEQPTICLARQVIARSTEQLAFMQLGNMLKRARGYDWRILPFVQDSYGRHPYKESLLKVPELVFDSRGKPAATRKVELIGSKERRKELFTGSPPMLSSILTDAGIFWGTECPQMTLPAFHGELWRKVTGENAQRKSDAGNMHGALLRHCMESASPGKPPYFFVEEGNRAVKCDISQWNDLPLDTIMTARPPAQWYYFFYLSLFITGKRILFASLDDDKDVHAMFQVMMEIANVTGRTPLIVAIPYKHKTDVCTLHFNEVNPTLSAACGWQALCEHPASESSSFYDSMLRHELFLSESFRM